MTDRTTKVVPDKAGLWLHVGVNALYVTPGEFAELAQKGAQALADGLPTGLPYIAPPVSPEQAAEAAQAGERG